MARFSRPAVTENGALPRAPKLAACWRWAVYAAAAGLWLTGIVWLCLIYGLAPDFDWLADMNPQWMLRFHALFGLCSVWLFGVLWSIHVTAGWAERRKRWTGGLLFALVLWLAITGYYIYHAVPSISAWVEWLHWTFGLGAPAIFLLHRFLPGAQRKG